MTANKRGFGGSRSSRYYPGQSGKIRFDLVPFFVFFSFAFLSLACASAFAASSSKTFVAFSLKAAQAKVEAAAKSGQDYRSAQLDLYQLGGITKPYALIVDNATNDVILVGERDPNASILTVDDLAVALRARFLHPDDNDPGVTIDPQTTDGSPGPVTVENMAPSQKVRFFAGVENTHFGEVCYESDWLMKRVGMNLDNLHTDGLQTYYDLLSAQQGTGGLAGDEISCRFWFLPIISEVGIYKDVVLLEDFKMGVFTQVLYAKVNGKPVADLDHFQSAASDGFSRSFSDHYNEAAKAAPVLETLRGLTRLAALAKGLEQTDDKPPIDYWLSTYSVEKVDTPTETDVLKTSNADQGWSLSGGVQLAALVLKFQKGDAQAFQELVLKTKPRSDALVWSFTVDFQNGVPVYVRVRGQVTDLRGLDELFKQAIFLRLQGHLDDADNIYKAILASNPDLWQIWSDDAGTLGMAGRYSESLTCSRRALVLNPNAIGAWNNEGQALEKLGFINNALQCYNQALKIDPHDVDVIVNKATALWKLHRPDDSLTWYCRALTLDPADEPAWCDKSVVLDDKGQYSEALKCCDIAIGLKQQDGNAWFNRGVALFNIGSYTEARSSFVQALDLGYTSAEDALKMLSEEGH